MCLILFGSHENLRRDEKEHANSFLLPDQRTASLITPQEKSEESTQ